MKVNVSLDDELLKKVDEFADNNYISRSALISLALQQFISADEVKKAIKELSVSMSRIAVFGSVSDEDRKRLDELAAFCKVLSGRVG